MMNNNKTVKKKKKKFIFRSCESSKNALSKKPPMDNCQRIENLKGQSEKKNVECFETLKSLEDGQEFASRLCMLAGFMSIVGG